ncbi:FAD-dependent monooxygenase [Nocardia sp. NPDC058499]|uniref:FAD-dependent monooxygenase n=1 Tax=Nocardia sp. NPDC058499 TaxID=3346530 RepID=UPI00364ECAE9
MTERCTTRVLISGGGVAGPVLAYWLRRYGFEPMIVEKAPQPRSGGQRVEIGEAGQEVLSRMGLLDRARTLGGAHPRSTVYTGAADRPVRVPDIGFAQPGNDRDTRNGSAGPATPHRAGVRRR